MIFIVSEKMQSNSLIQIQETQIQQEQAQGHRACRRPIPKFNCFNSLEIYCSTETVFLIVPFLQTNITSQMWPSEGKRKGKR